MIEDVRLDYKFCNGDWFKCWYMGIDIDYISIILVEVLISLVLITFFVKEIENEDQKYFRENRHRVEQTTAKELPEV